MKKRKLEVSCPAFGRVPPGFGRSRKVMRSSGDFAYPFIRDETKNGFTRGFIAAGLVAAMTPECINSREVLRLAFQGGTAMAAGIASANAIDRRDYGTAVRALAAGIAGLVTINYALPRPTKVQSDKEKKAHE